MLTCHVPIPSSDVAATSAPVNAAGHQSTPADHDGDRRSTPSVNVGQRRRPPINADGSRWRSTTVAGGEPPLTTTGPPVNGGWWAGQRSGLDRSGSGLGRVRVGSGSGLGRHISTSAIPHEALSRVTSLDGEERVQSQDLEITQLKAKVKIPEDNKKRREGFAQDDALNTRDIDQGEDLLDKDKSDNKGSDNTYEMLRVLGSLGATNILASGGLRSVFTTASLSVATVSIGISLAVATASGSFPTAAIFNTASVATPTTRVTRSSRRVVIGSSSLISTNNPSISKKDKGKGKMIEPEQPSIEKRSEIVRIHAKKELEMMIAELDRSTEMVAKYLSGYEQAKVSNVGWKAKDFKGMTFEQIEEKFIPVRETMQDFVPTNSKLESERLKRPGIQLDKERIKKLKTTKALGTEPTKEQQSKEPKELSKEELKKMMEEDLDKLWSLVKESCSTTKVTDEKEKELWVELKRLYEHDSRDLL
nr:hypothetical protein [Tanacetum cinerariifolium]